MYEPSVLYLQVGGALSFGFFLGCGMVIRCQEARRPRVLEAPHEPLSTKRSQGVMSF